MAVFTRHVRKTEIRLELGFKNEPSKKNDIRSDGFLIETACNLPFK